MKSLLDRLHARMGDLWWYSLMIFVACRSGDVIQAFIGLWLVPKYVGPNELGAVLPIQQLSGLFAVPLAILATVFAKYVNTYATRGELGKVKSFIHDVLLASIGVFVFCIAAAYLIIPHFYVRLNVASGMLTILILASGFVGNVSSLFSSALQGLKKFKTMTVQSLISAPIRLVTLLVAMPIRALSGYILGQTTPPATCSVLAAFSLHHDLRAIPSDPTWRRDLPEIWRYLWPYAVCTIFGTIFGSISMTVYRQRLPEVESAAHYMITRFSETAGYIGASIGVVLFPLVSEAHESGNNTQKILYRSLIGIAISVIPFVIGFHFLAKPLFSLVPAWRDYVSYAYLLPVMTIITGIGTGIGLCTSYGIACRRFAAITFVTIFNFFWTIFLVSFTGYEFYRGILPDTFVNWMGDVHLATLANLTWASLISAIIQIIGLLFIVNARKASQENYD